MTSSYLISVKRTAAQAAAAWVVAQAARAGIDLPGDALTDLFFTGIFVAYYALYRIAEQKFPQLLRLIGSGAQPVYVDPLADVDAGESDEDG